MTGPLVAVVVNGQPRRVAAGTTLAGLVHELAEGPDGPGRSGLSGGATGIAVAVDREVVPRSQWGEVVVRDGASVEVVAAAAGG